LSNIYRDKGVYGVFIYPQNNEAKQDVDKNNKINALNNTHKYASYPFSTVIIIYLYSIKGSVVRLNIYRDKGAYGEVSVFIYPQNKEAKQDVDYICQPQVL